MLVGGMVIVAGVAFVVISAGASILVLAPAVLMADASPRSEPSTAELSP